VVFSKSTTSRGFSGQSKQFAHAFATSNLSAIND
jgi:hypothetical protein